MTTFIPSRRLLQAMFSSFIFGCAALLSAQAGGGDARNGLSHSEQSKVARALAWDRLRSNDLSGSNSATVGTGVAKATRGKDCTTNVGTVEINQGRPGVRGPREIITVIKAPVINKC